MNRDGEAEGTQPHDYWEEREAAKKINALYASNIYVMPVAPNMVRLNFGDALDDEPTYHTALVLTAENARDFAKLVYQIAVRMAPEPEPPSVTTNVQS